MNNFAEDELPIMFFDNHITTSRSEVIPYQVTDERLKDVFKFIVEKIQMYNPGVDIPEFDALPQTFENLDEATR